MRLNFKRQDETLFKPLYMKDRLGLHVKKVYSLSSLFTAYCVLLFVLFILLDSSLLSNFFSGQ